MATSAGLKVDFGLLFKKEYQHFPVADKLAIAEFASHLSKLGFNGLQGRNKSSDSVPTNDPKWSEKVSYAQRYHLWHYHIGIISYDMDKPFGDRTSEYVVHYQRLGNVVRIVDYSAHPPFQLPTEDYLK